MSPTNKAVYATGTKSGLTVKSAPYTSPKSHQIVIQNHAVAINPLDWMKIAMGNMVFPWIKYPFVLGSDTAGEVVEVGSDVSRFQLEDRVVGHALGMAEKYNTSSMSGFQEYTVLVDHMTSKIPKELSYEDACVLPLGVSTAACGLFQKDQLALQLPTIPIQKPNNMTLIVWGGSSSVGCNAIQLAVAAGYEVITTCSPKNFSFVKQLGASQVFDYNSPTVVKDIVQAMKGKKSAGAISIGGNSADNCMDILPQCAGNRFISIVTYPVLSPPPIHFALLRTVVHFLSWNVSFWIKGKTRGVRSKFVFGDTLAWNSVGKDIYEGFLEEALMTGWYKSSPEPLVVGKGLEFVEKGFEIQKKGMSAKKVVVTL